MSSDYGVAFDTTAPARFDRSQVILRILIVVVLSILAGTFGWVMGVVYLGVPVVAAVLISQKGGERYLAEADANMTQWLRYIIGFYAYLSLLTDRLPLGSADAGETVRFEVRPSGSPTVGDALLRILLAFPSVIVLGLLWLVGSVLLVIGAVSILVNESCPAGIYDFLRGLNRWQARLLAYLASLVGAYPPFALETGSLAASASGEA